MKENLYILGYPRSMSTVIYYVAAHSIKKVYNGVDGGEFTNPDRVFKPITTFHEEVNTKLKKEGIFWSNKHYNLITELYDHLHKQDKTIVIKEVIYPQILSDFIKKNKAKTLLVEKDIPLTAYSLIKNGWFYPTRLLYKEDPKGVARVIALLKSLKYVKDNYFNVLKNRDHVETINANEVMFTNNIFDKMEKLGFKVKRFNYLTNDVLKNKYKKVEAYKETDLYKQILKVWRRIE